MKLTVTAGNNLGVESDSQANQIKFSPATMTLKRKAASSEQTIVLCLCACLATKWLYSGPHPASPGLHVKTSISQFTTGRWDTSPLRGPPLPCGQTPIFIRLFRQINRNKQWIHVQQKNWTTVRWKRKIFSNFNALKPDAVPKKNSVLIGSIQNRDNIRLHKTETPEITYTIGQIMRFFSA